MIHGDIVTITSEGIIVHEKALQPLGIFDQSVCWAVWAANPHLNLKPEQVGYPNLVISPIHPSSWPFLIRLEIDLQDREGALAWLCKELNELGLSMLFIESITTGFNHALCIVIAESILDKDIIENAEKKDYKRLKEEIEKLEEHKNEKQKFDRDRPFVRISDKQFEDAQNLANKIAAVMFIRAKKIGEYFNELVNSNKEHFLHSWALEKENNRFNYNEDKVIQEMLSLESSRSEDDLRKFFKNHPPQTASAEYMQRLAYFSIYGGGINVPFSLRYHADAALLKLEREGIFSEDVIKIYEEEEDPPRQPFKLGPLPRAAISTFNSQDKYLRLKPITDRILKHKLTRISVEYRLEQQRARAAETSKGLVHLISKQLETLNINLLHASNKWTRYEYNMGAGLISFIADVPEPNYKEVKEAIKLLNYSESPVIKNSKIEKVSVNEYPQRRKLFLSLRFGHHRHEDLLNIIDEVALTLGFEKTMVETYVAPATRTIIEQITSCQAFLQLLLFRDMNDAETMSFSWLDFEYGVASGKGMPTIRLVDTVLKPYNWWIGRITTNPDQRVRDFRSDASKENLKRTIRKAVEELSQELLRRQQEIGS